MNKQMKNINKKNQHSKLILKNYNDCYCYLSEVLTSAFIAHVNKNVIEFNSKTKVLVMVEKI